MQRWIRDRWRRITTQRCDACGALVRVTDFRETGGTRGGTWWSGSDIELQCPRCSHTFWAKK
ncbi:MAG: hypothetical protein WBN35_05460 [Acidimicrobiia bacterium]